MDDMEFIGESLTDVHDLIRDEMTEEDDKRFREMNSDEERIQFILNIEKINQLLTPIRKTNNKDNAKAHEFRKAGNILFQKRRYMQALEHYNYAVAHATKEDVSSEEPGEMVSALGNRSAVLAHRMRYALSIQNADMALELGYPENRRYRLLERKAVCMMHLKQPDNATKQIKAAIANVKKSNIDESKQIYIINRLESLEMECKSIKEERNDEPHREENTSDQPVIEEISTEYSNMSAKFDVIYYKDSGRGLVAKEDVYIGEPVVIQRPYASVLYPPYWHNHCYNCLTVLIVTYPCRSTTMFNFCGQACEHEAWQTYLPYEQYLEDILQKKWCGTIGHLVLRIAITAGLDAINNPDKDKMRILYQQFNSKRKPKAFLNIDGEYTNDFNTIYNMESQCDSRADMGLFDLSVASIFLMKVLEIIHFIPPGDTNNVSIASCLMHIMEIVQCNALSIPEVKYPTDFEKPGTVEIGIGLYTTGALINHSCDPSADWTCFSGNHLVVRTARLLYKGYQVTIAYRDRVFYSSSIAMRQAQLKFQYGFNCKCRACVNRWGKYNELNTTLPQYKCCKCRSELLLGIVVDGTSARCEKCNELQDLQWRVKALVSNHEKYAEAMSYALSGNIKLALPELEKYLAILQRFLCAPWRELTACQAAVQQCYRLHGNKRVID